MGHVGVRVRANASRCVRRLEVAVRRSAGALAATRQQSCGCAYSDVRWGRTASTHARLAHGMVEKAPVCVAESDHTIEVPLGTGTAMAAEVVGVSVLTGVLDLFLHKSLSV